MKLTKISNLILLGLALTLISTGCKKKPVNVTNLPGGRTKPMLPQPGLESGTPIDPNAGTRGIVADPGTGNIRFDQNGPDRSLWPADREALKGQTVYFEFDKSSIKSSEQTKLEEVATYLKSNSSAAVRVEGNCDERGTEEYNRSLGERRALAAREALAKLGIDAGRVDVTTFGEDKPAIPGHDESAFSKNRRDEFIVLTPPKQ